MVRYVAIVLILAHIIQLMFMVQASVKGGSLVQKLPAIEHVERKADSQHNIEAEQPSANDDQPHFITEGEGDGGFEAEAPASRRLGKGKHKDTDPSVAGGGVILGGLALAVFAAVFSYIRVTRKKSSVNV